MSFLDEVDQKILKLLLDDARASISRIARELGLSRPTVRRRIKRLIESGVIKGFSVIVDDSMLKGFQLICLFKAPNADEIVGELEKLSEVSDIYLTSGERNVVCIARITDVKALEALLSKFSSLNVPFEVSIVLKFIKKPFPPMFLQIVKLQCDYCGKEIIGKPIAYTLHNRKYYLCCPTCLKQFSRKMKLVTSS